MSPGRVVLTFGGLTLPVDITGSDPATVRNGDAVVMLTVAPHGVGTYAVTCNGRRALAHYARDGRMYFLHVDGQTYAFERDHAETRARVAASGHDVRAPMPGVVTRLFVREGQIVAAGDPLYVVEAMKIETVIRAPAAGRVERIHSAPGAQIEAGAIVIEVKPSER
ncbi:MAG TPA: biotin/lipoyl-containing protein [bacterium]|nr:biotin/lipoyl-containing protein [bacterium]